jgi:uncharacterized protein YqgQ
MCDSWKREADYQMAKVILESLLKKGLLTASEYKTAIRKITSKMNPPVSKLTGD